MVKDISLDGMTTKWLQILKIGSPLNFEIKNMGEASFVFRDKIVGDHSKDFLVCLKRLTCKKVLE